MDSYLSQLEDELKNKPANSGRYSKFNLKHFKNKDGLTNSKVNVNFKFIYVYNDR